VIVFNLVVWQLIVFHTFWTGRPGLDIWQEVGCFYIPPCPALERSFILWTPGPQDKAAGTCG